MISHTRPPRPQSRARLVAVAACVLAFGGGAVVACGGDDDDDLPVPTPTESNFGIPAPVDNSGVNQGPANTAEQAPGGTVVAETGVAP